MLRCVITQMRKRFRQLGLLLLIVFTAWGTVRAAQLYRHSQQPADAVLVLGGSIQREIYAASEAAAGVQLPVLISQGSQPPCIRILYERAAAPLGFTWLEGCARSTFDNYRYSLPTLKRWGTRRVRVVTSGTHVQRAKWLAMILLGSHGIWVEMDPVEEQGIPANTESRLKTTLDVIRSLGWAAVSQVYRPRCNNVIPLSTVDLEAWNREGFKCEHQGGISSFSHLARASCYKST